MEITRHGAKRYKGTKTIARIDFADKKSWKDSVTWDAYSKKVEICSIHVPLGDGRTSHNYRVYLSLQDVAALIATLAHAGSAADAQLLRAHLKDQIPSLVKLLACATGLVPTPIPEGPEK